jgi:hypothetical protein
MESDKEIGQKGGFCRGLSIRSKGVGNLLGRQAIDRLFRVRYN